MFLKLLIDAGLTRSSSSQFSSRAHKLLLVGIVEGVCRQAIVHEIPGIARCFVAKAANENDAANVSPFLSLPLARLLTCRSHSAPR